MDRTYRSLTVRVTAVIRCIGSWASEPPTSVSTAYSHTAMFYPSVMSQEEDTISGS
uniref:Uncharacterized protein n=1 Tax=Anguilla anguilla TaxID=7936 RepID=A0A0E9V862_ANGAN